MVCEREQKSNTITHICGIMLFALFLGEQIKLLGLPLYLVCIISSIIIYIYNNHFMVKVKKSIPSIIKFSVFWIIISTFTTIIHFNTSQIHSLYYCIITSLILIIITYSINNKEDLDLLMRYYFLGVLFSIVITVIELKTGYRFTHSIIGSDYYFRMGVGNAFGYQVNVNDHASILMICIFGPIYFLRKHMILNIGLIILLIYLLKIVGSRMALLAVLLLIAEALFTLLITKLSWFKGTVGKAIIIFITVFMVLVFIQATSYLTVLKLLGNASNYNSDIARVDYIIKAVRQLNSIQMFIGNGAGATQNIIHNSIHCVLIEMLCDYGIFIFIWVVKILYDLLMIIVGSYESKCKYFVFSVTMSFILLSFCSSSMLRIHIIWALLAITYNYKRLFDDCRSIDIG